jgi:penicillin-binding protein 2
MQLAQATAILANKGVAMRPHVVAAITDAKTGVSKAMPTIISDKIPLDDSNLEIVKLGMIDVTLPGGTAASVGANAGYSIAAKTGTAQVVGMKQNEKYNADLIDERHRDHALFIAYAPSEDPKIALAVIVENGGHGGSAAGPIARKVMDYYLLGKIPEIESPKVSETATKPNGNNATLPAAPPENAPEEERYD